MSTLRQIGAGTLLTVGTLLIMLSAVVWLGQQVQAERGARSGPDVAAPGVAPITAPGDDVAWPNVVMVRPIIHNLNIEPATAPALVADAGRPVLLRLERTKIDTPIVAVGVQGEE